MRFLINYKIDRLPIAHRMMFVSLLKKALSDYNEELYKELYLYDEGKKKNKKSKDFSLSIHLNNYKREGNEFLLESVSLTISTSDRILGIHLYNALLKLKKYTFKNVYTLEKISSSMLNTKVIKNNHCLFKTKSPLVVKNNENKFLDISDEGFLDELNYMANKMLENFRGYGLRDKLEFIPIDMKKIVVKESIEDFTRVSKKEYIHINSSVGVFALKGNIQDLNEIYLLGLGFRRNQGFGMIDIL